MNSNELKVTLTQEGIQQNEKRMKTEIAALRILYLVIMFTVKAETEEKIKVYCFRELLLFKRKKNAE